MRFAHLALTIALVTPAAAHAQMTSGKLLIKLERPSKTDADARANLSALDHAKDLGLTLEKRTVVGWVVVDIAAQGEAETHAAIDALSHTKGVLAVSPVTMKKALRAPSDELYPQLWGFQAIDIETAWDTTVGSPNQRIGLIDSGINRDHIDLIDRDLGGFDFISDAQNGADGTGRDADYTDSDVTGDFHGSHVAGTMAASADDGIGVPGLNWNAGLITARALGSLGGDVVDIAEAAIWLAGGHIDGVPDIGANRVSVINMSLGSDGPCESFESDVYSAVTAAGVTVVAAAGNSGNEVPTGSPASCPTVIAVGAAGPTFDLASYSNFDSRIDVVAPGGDGSGPDDTGNSILSVDGSTESGYITFDGTSMASPHVAGVVSLMQAVNPQLSPRQIKDILTQSPFTCGDCANEAFLDAPSAVSLAQSTAGELTTTPPPPSGTGDNTGTASCPPNSTATADGQSCQCNPGFVVNAQQTGCVSSGGGNTGGGGGSGGGNTSDACPPHSSLTPDGEACQCDAGFVVNEAQTACVAPDTGGGNTGSESCTTSLTSGDSCGDGFRCVDGACVERSSRDDRDNANLDDSSGCSATGASSLGSIFALAALIRRRRR